MKALTFVMECLEPLLIADPISGDENSATGLEYIPGSVIRGALTHIFTGGRRGDLSGAQFRRLFFGDTRFLNAYPVIQDMRSLPTPRSWRREKDGGDEAYVFDLANRSPDTDQQLKSVSWPFVHVHRPSPRITEDDQADSEGEAQVPEITLFRPERDIRVHIAQPDRVAAARKGAGSVYRYDALAAGQRFAGAILSEHDDVLDWMASSLGSIVKLGKSRSAGYGAVRVMDVRQHPDWREYEPFPAPDSSHVVVTLLSDAILRDPQTGAYAESPDDWFGAPSQHGFARLDVVGGFNLTWGLPLPQAYAIRAGSVFVFDRSDALTSRLQQAEITGIGDRLNEGYGRIAVNWHTAPLFLPRSDLRQTGSEQILLTNDGLERRLAQRMVNRIWRIQLDNALRDAISNSRLDRPPANSQLSRMRLLAREAWRQNTAALIGDVLKQPDKQGKNAKAMKQHARDQFQQARVHIAGQSKTLIEWLEELADKPQKVWPALQTGQLRRPEIGGVKAEDPPALEYAARLIDGVLRKAAREGRE